MPDTDAQGLPAIRTRAKFYIGGLELLPGKDAGVKVTLSAVSRGDRNANWANATPVGNMTMTINNPQAARQWEDFMQAARATGKQPELFIDITPAEDGWAGDGHPFRLADIPAGNYGHDNCGECGFAKDGFLTTYDEVTHKNVPDESRPFHPNG